ncbi:LacI family DNA-binding transcriptional regulator [Clavibacter tessellarius]|uniref:LacI family DNA-binding transcriptional regulator n=1 Tax=Clavibacter tessellarius TaxID=31965 RepID=UPI003251EA0C
MSDVARAAGVSIKTVSNYFNGYPYMRDGTRARIEAAVAELGYRMNVSARNLRSGRSRMIALVIPEARQRVPGAARAGRDRRGGRASASACSSRRRRGGATARSARSRACTARCSTA